MKQDKNEECGCFGFHSAFAWLLWFALLLQPGCRLSQRFLRCVLRSHLELLLSFGAPFVCHLFLQKIADINLEPPVVL